MRSNPTTPLPLDVHPPQSLVGELVKLARLLQLFVADEARHQDTVESIPLLTAPAVVGHLLPAEAVVREDVATQRFAEVLILCGDDAGLWVDIDKGFA